MAENKKRNDVERYLISSLKDKKSLQVVLDRGITKDFFTPGAHYHLFRLATEYYTKYEQPLTPKVLGHQVTHLDFTKGQVANLQSTFKIIQSKEVDQKELPYYCDVLKDFHAKTSFKNVVSEALEVSKEEGVGSNIKAIKEAQEKLTKLSDNLLEKEVQIDIVSIRDMEFIIKEQLVKRKANPEKYAGITTGITEIDKALGAGMRPGELTIFMAPPAGGKTTTMLSVADAIFVNKGKNVAYISLEMENNRIAMKHLANNAVFDATKLEMADINKKAKEDIDQAFAKRRKVMEEKGCEFDYVYIAGSGRVATSYLDQAIKQIMADHPIDVLVVDYLECLVTGQSEEHWLEMGNICKYLRGTGARMGFTAISGVQMKRDAISRMRKTKDSELSFGADDAQGSNQISADCDRIYALIIDPKDNSRMNFFSAKDRYGENSYKCSLYFDGACSRLYGDETTYDHSVLMEDDDLSAVINNSGKNIANAISEADEVDDSVLDYRDEIDYDEDDDEEFNFQ
jgi:replicative DNA helicase